MIVYLLLYFFIIVPSAIIHEYAHGWMAEQLGDSTARYAGRLTLNPKNHIDLFGTILLPIGLFILSGGGFMFAYAKPVPYNPYNLRDQKWGPAYVGLAGPMANFLLAASFAVVYRFMAPISPVFADMLYVVISSNVMLMVFNLVPLPPLDGSKVLLALLPEQSRQVQIFFQQYGFVLLMLFVYFGSGLLSPIIRAVLSLLVG